MGKLILITGHGKLEFIQKADGHLELAKAEGRSFLSKEKLESIKKKKKPLISVG